MTHANVGWSQEPPDDLGGARMWRKNNGQVVQSFTPHSIPGLKSDYPAFSGFVDKRILRDRDGRARYFATKNEAINAIEKRISADMANA